MKLDILILTRCANDMGGMYLGGDDVDIERVAKYMGGFTQPTQVITLILVENACIYLYFKINKN